MFYEFSDDVVSISKEEISQSFFAAGFINSNELDEAAQRFGFSRKTVMMCREESLFQERTEVYEDYYFAVLKLINPERKRNNYYKAALYIKKNLVLIIGPTEGECFLRDAFLKAIKHFSAENVSAAKFIYALFSGLTESNSARLESTALYINSLESRLLRSPAEEDFNSLLFSVKNNLLLLRNYYNRLIDLAEVLEEDESELFEEKDLKYLRLCTVKAERLKDNVDALRESAVHLKEAYESSLELELNKTMKIFTLFTVVFSPLNFIAAWYGMNFTSMPELKWRFGYLFVIAASLITLSGVLVLFKKKRWI